MLQSNFTQSHRYHLIIISCIICILVLACAPQEADQKPEIEKKIEIPSPIKYGNTYRFPLRNNPPTLDPAYVQDLYGITVVHQLFDRLVQFGPYLNVLPQLAENWQVLEDGKLYRFSLRSDARFHDGTKVSIKDVIFSIRRLLRIEPPAAVLPHLLKIDGAEAFRQRRSDKIAGLDIISPNILEIRLTEPHVPFLTALGMYQVSIIPEHAVQNKKLQFGRNPIGSGPYEFTSWKEDESIELKRFPDYFAGAAFLEGIRYKIYPGGQTDRILTDFQTRNLEEMPVFGDVRQQLASQKDYQWRHRPALSLLFYGINCKHPNLQSPAFRKKLSKAINRSDLVKNVYKGQFVVANTILPPGLPGYSPPKNDLHDTDLTASKQNPSKSADNHPDTVEIVTAIKSSHSLAELDIVRKAWAKLGISVKVKFITDWSEYEKYLQSDAVQIYRYVWSADMPDPDSFLYPLFASDSANNFTKFHAGEVDRLLGRARSIIDPIKRAEMYQRIETLILDSAPIIPLFYLSIDRVYQPNVQGIAVNALGPHYMPLHRVWLKTSTQRNQH